MDVTVLTTGGTIASTAGDGGATPSKGGSELVDAIPQLREYAAIEVEEPVQTPSYEMDADTLETIGDRIGDLDANAGVDAVVVTHGTDTMAETAYYVDVAVDPETPVLLTGAQRRPDELAPDGPTNVLAAVRAGRAFHDRGAGGTYVAFDGEIHAAKTATKVHTSNLDAFESPTAGPVATIDREGLAIYRPPRSETATIPATSLDAAVYAIESGSCVGRELLDAALERGADGLVVEGTGLGNATAPIGEGVRDAVAAGVPVVVTSRCLAGRTSAVYGGTGGGECLREYGAIFAGSLSTGKARLKLALSLSAFGDDREAIRDAFGG